MPIPYKTSPAAMFIEIAADSLKGHDKGDPLYQSQLHELGTFGDWRAQQLGATGLSEDFKLGYLLGLETVRAMNAVAGVGPAEL